MSSELERREVENLIFYNRDKHVMLDFHLASIYAVETKRLNEQVKRNSERFPQDFMFQLTEEEWEELQSQITNMTDNQNLRSQIATAKRRSLPFVFTEQGVAMLSAVLRSDVAIQVSIEIMNAFITMRQQLNSNQLLIKRIDSVELKQLESDQKFEQIFKALESKNPTPAQGTSSMGRYSMHIISCLT